MNDYSTGGAAWFAIALINAGLAEQKYRSRIAWFLISVFVGLCHPVHRGASATAAGPESQWWASTPAMIQTL